MTRRVGPAEDRWAVSPVALRRNAGRMVLAGMASTMILALTGCGGGDADSRVATAVTGSPHGGAKTTATAEDSDVASYVKGMRKWVKCLRSQGIDASDPDAVGVVKFPENSGSAKTDPKFVAAQEKCSPLLPAVPESVLRQRTPKLSAQQIEVQRRYAACMQENGAPDFPDPGPDGYVPTAQENWNQASSGAQRAFRACASIIGDPTHPSASRG